MSMMQSINKMFGSNKPKAFMVDDEAGRCCDEDVNLITKTLNVDVERFTDFKSLLYKLRTNNYSKYKIGIIHENGTKYPSQMLSQFIKVIDPSIKLIIYKDNSELVKETETMVLT